MDDALSDDDEDGVPLTQSAKKQRKPPARGESNYFVRHKGSFCYILLSLAILIGAGMFYKSKIRFGTENPKPDFHPPGWRDPMDDNKNNRSPEPDLSSPVQSPPNDENSGMGKEKWGYWKFYDGGADSRPEGDYCGKYENRDIPGDEFPENAWQTDAVYVNHFLDEALKLVARTKEAIYAEYGAGEPLDDSKRERREAMFHVNLIDCDKASSDKDKEFAKVHGQTGWICKESYHGLVRRLIHAIMTNDSFTVTMGGHSAAAGHGNHFLQSYTMQIALILTPLFEKLGVKFNARNLAQGGLGTLQSSLGSFDIYGSDTDFLIWDSSMTEGIEALDVFIRQGMLMPRAPYLHSFHDVQGRKGSIHVDSYKKYHIDIGGGIGGDFKGFLKTTSEEVAARLPFSSRYLYCSDDLFLCKDIGHRYRTKCWIDRDDFTPKTAQEKFVRGRASWHPGFRYHQVQGRGITMLILSALETAFSNWSDSTITNGHPLLDVEWHMTEYYSKIHAAVKNDKTMPCLKYFKDLSPRACSTSLNARTMFTPRANPDETSIRSIIVMPEGTQLNEIPSLLYEGENVPNPMLMVPEGEIDVLKISNYQKRSLAMEIQKDDRVEEDVVSKGELTQARRGTQITPESNMWYHYAVRNGHCDGSLSSSTCNRQDGNTCLLSGHNDERSGIIGDSYSGWLVMNLKDVKEGLIIVKFQLWKNSNVVGGSQVPTTEGMDKGERRFLRKLSNETSKKDDDYILNEDDLFSDNVDHSVDLEYRFTKADPDDAIPDEFEFDFAIDGKVTTWNKKQILEKRQKLQRVVELFTLLDDEDWGEKRDVEVAIRSRGGGRVQTLDLTHIYWA